MNPDSRAKLDANMTENHKAMEFSIWYQNAARATHVALGQKVPYDEAVDAGFNYANGVADARETMVELIRQQAWELSS